MAGVKRQVTIELATESGVYSMRISYPELGRPT